MASQPPMTSSPIKPVTDLGHEIWCGGDTSNNNNNSKPSKIRNIRQTVEQQLQNLALNGQTSKLIKLLEDGAPFVVDMVSLEKIFSNLLVSKLILMLLGQTKICSFTFL